MDAYKYLHFLLAISLLWGCAPGDSTELPSERPPGVIKGSAVDGLLAGAQVSIYGLENGDRGVKLGGATTDASGVYSVNIQTHSRPFLIEVRGGSYVEEASGVLVTLEDGQVLRAIGMYESGLTHDAMVTPLTHMATALAEHKIANGMSVEVAIAGATSTIDQFFALDVGATRPVRITSENSEATEFGHDVLYGFYLAGLSDWTLWAGKQNQAAPPHTTYTSIALSQILYHDLRSDGLLNGIGFNQDGTELERLGFGVMPLDEDAYRLTFSLHMLAIANSAENKTRFTVDDLLDAAHRIASQTTLLVGASDPVDIDNQTPTLSIDKPVGEYHSGLFTFQVNVGSVLGAESIALSISAEGQVESEDEIDLENPGSVSISVDTTDYADGEHQFNLGAVDVLGNNGSAAFIVQFDNTAPVIIVTSPLATNQAVAQISGVYSDNIAGIASITVGGQAATLFVDGTWNVSLAIEPGKNIIPISVIDLAGNRNDTIETVYLDDIGPVIDSTGKHSQARFSNGDGNYTEASLEDSNDNVPLYFETDNTELGSVLINRQALDDNAIPYFGFDVSDQMGPGVATDPQDIRVRVQYQRNDQVLNPWHALAPVGDEYLIPLASEALSSGWLQSTPQDEHLVQVEVTDVAGNQTLSSFRFRAAFYVPAFTIDADNISDLGADIFSTAAFAERATLNGMQFASTAYNFTNTIGKAFYVSLNDDSLHATSQIVEQLVREHLIKLKATTEWRLGLMEPADQCPEMSGWTITASVWNWSESGWVEEQAPGPTYGAEEAIFEDALPASPSMPDWSDAPDFDPNVDFGSAENSLSLLTYLYDYKLDPSPAVQTSAYVLAWTLRDKDSSEVQTCPQARYFQQRETYVYESVNGYPQPVLSTIAISSTPDFLTTRYSVMDNDTGLDIVPVNGWHHIPTGHSISIQKWVTTPDLTLYSDDISDVSNFSSYTPNQHDKTISWLVARKLDMSLVHDAGEGNIPLMPVRGITVGEGEMVYQTSR